MLIAASDTAYAYFGATREVWGHQETAVGWVLGFVAIGLGALSMPAADRGDSDDADGDHLVRCLRREAIAEARSANVVNTIEVAA